jgi:hypothetical protein
VFECAPRELDRHGVLPDDELRVGQQEVGLDLVRELRGSSEALSAPSAWASRIVDSSKAIPAVHELGGPVADRSGLPVHLGDERREEAAAWVDARLDVPQVVVGEPLQALDRGRGGQRRIDDLLAE